MPIGSAAFVINDRYEVGEPLGKGGMGEVRRAHDRKLHRDVAIKFLRADLAAQAEARRRFTDEARNAARLNHPNVVLVLDFGEHEGTPFLVMECLAGHTLHDELQRGPLDEASAKVIAHDVQAGLAAAHELGIVHRDISPANILLTEDGHAKIADFGISKSAEAAPHTMVGQVMGTPAYLAPDRLRGEAATPASDVYSLGVTMYEALTGDRPFKGDSPMEIAQAVLTTKPTPLAELRPDLDPELTQMVDVAMATGETVAVATPAMATVATPIVDGAPPRRDRRAVWMAVATVALFGVLLLGLVSAGDDGTPATATEPTTITTAAPPPTTVATTVGVRLDLGDNDNDNDRGGDGKRKGGKRRGDD
jgi:eukaryotic-like serine/threonine-protein kinase